ncbi:hypothetical protein G6011_03686 [Alternaria panax]|uniref:Uncharacterized protein n=1 Tax=Alternaria panax TaxID=48097 RepID=A0AAD4IFV8_9PLEO|nr:hypothetical protein G6011_03686 [Alternaria panax]
MSSIRQSCQSALLRSNNVCLYANGTRRAFSRTLVNPRGALPNFLPPSKPELSELLSKFNAKVLLPSHLTKEQQKLVYKEESRAKLEAEPVEITLGDVTLPLEHLDRNRLPNRFKTFRKIVAESETREDWENVARCLEGFEEAGIKAESAWQEMVIRKLDEADMHHLVLKILQRPKATGVRLSNLGVLRQVLRGVHDKAALSDWAEEETTKMYKQAKQIVELMENEEHHKVQKPPFKKREEVAAIEGDWRGKPSVVALPTELAAMLAEKHGGDKEEVKKLSNRLVNALKQSGYATSLDMTSVRSSTNTDTFQNITTKLEFVKDHCHDLFDVLIVWNALKTSRKVLGAQMPMADEAQKFEARAEEVLMEGMRSLDTMPRNKDGKPLNSAFVKKAKDALEKCR